MDYKSCDNGDVRLIYSKSSRIRYLFLLTVTFGGSLLLLTISQSTEILNSNVPSVSLRYSKHYKTIADEEFTIKTEGCTIRGMKPFDKSIREFVGFPNDMPQCPHTNHSLLEKNRTHIWLNRQSMRYYNLTNTKRLACCYNAFYRPDAVDDIMAKDIDNRLKYKPCRRFSDIIEVYDENVKVTCIVKRRKVYEQFYVFALLKKNTLYDGLKEIPSNKTAYNVLIIGIDNVSRLNFHRTMPKTLSYVLEKGAVELLGYNKIGDNSFPNLVAMLLGHKDTEIKHICHPFKNSFFDACPFIWHRFKEAGYYTALGEDSAELGTFNYMLNGFMSTPTDYYYRPFIHESENKVGNNKVGNSYLCMKNRFFYQVFLDYIADLTDTLKQSKLFGFFWEITMSHDFLNYPMVMDKRYEEFFKKLDTSKYLNDSIIFLVSDHGMRWGSIRTTTQGRLEERLPFMYVLTPESFREKYSEAYKNLKTNSQRLITPFDLHETLLDLVNMENVNNENIVIKSRGLYTNNRGISLFLEIPSNRTCSKAGIDDHWCSCFSATVVSNDTKEATAAAGYVLGKLNLMLQGFSQCSPLSLVEVLEMSKLFGRTGEDGWSDYMVKLRASPGDMVFESTVRYENSNWTVSGLVSRLTLYGNQSYCVQDPILKLYCYCKIQVL